jgi:hypothetical protein
MQARSLSLKFAFCVPLAVFAPQVSAHDGVAGALPRANFAAPFGPALAVSDFDNDRQADAAVLVEHGRPGQRRIRVELHLSGRDKASFSFPRTAAAYAVAAWDVDRDGDIDVVVHRPVTAQRLHVWLNDGSGGFHQVRNEHLPGPAAPAREHLRHASSRLDVPPLTLPSQRSYEFALLAAGRLPHRSLPAGKRLPISSTAADSSVLAAQISPRAPPSSSTR